MATKKITDFTESTSPNNSWFALVSDASGNYFKVKLSNLPGGGTSLTQLTTPTLTASTASSTAIDLSWTNVANESSYLLEWSPNGTTSWTQIGGTIAANTTTYQHTGLNPNTAYYYRVKAIGDNVTYSNSNYSPVDDTTTSNIDSDAQAFLTAAAISDTDISNAVNALVTKMKSDGIWTKMDAVYPFVGGSSSSHAVNLKTPGTFNLTFNGGWTHSATGAKGNGSDGYAATGYIPRSNLTQFSSAIGAYSRDNPTLSASEYRVLMGVQKAGIDTGITYYNASSTDRLFGTAGSNTNSGFNEGVLENPKTSYNKLLVVSRTANNVIKMFRNGTQLATTNTTTTVENNPETYAVFLGAGNIDGTATYFSNIEFGFAFMGDGLTDADVSNLTTAVNTFETSLSRNV
jgi:hypothetical protein